MLKLHTHPATVAPSLAITLEELGLEYEAIFVDFATTAPRSAEHMALNPKGRVPVLETPQGIITENGAILEYIAAAHGPQLVPNDPFAAAMMRETMFYLASTMHIAHAHKMRGARWADLETSHADMTAKVPETMTASCAYLEDHLPLSPFAQGDTMTLADPYLFIVTRWAEGDGVDMTAFPKLSAHQAMMAARPSVQAILAKGILA